MQNYLQTLQYNLGIYNDDIEPEHETEYNWCTCSVHQYQRRKYERLPVQNLWSKAVLYPGMFRAISSGRAPQLIVTQAKKHTIIRMLIGKTRCRFSRAIRTSITESYHLTGSIHSAAERKAGDGVINRGRSQDIMHRTSTRPSHSTIHSTVRLNPQSMPRSRSITSGKTMSSTNHCRICTLEIRRDCLSFHRTQLKLNPLVLQIDPKPPSYRVSENR